MGHAHFYACAFSGWHSGLWAWFLTLPPSSFLQHIYTELKESNVEVWFLSHRDLATGCAWSTGGRQKHEVTSWEGWLRCRGVPQSSIKAFSVVIKKSDHMRIDLGHMQETAEITCWRITKTVIRRGFPMVLLPYLLLDEKNSGQGRGETKKRFWVEAGLRVQVMVHAMNAPVIHRPMMCFLAQD